MGGPITPFKKHLIFLVYPYSLGGVSMACSGASILWGRSRLTMKRNMGSASPGMEARVGDSPLRATNANGESGPLGQSIWCYHRRIRL